MRVEVFSGWINLRDPKLVPEKLRRPIFAKSVTGSQLADNEENVTEESMEFFSMFNDLLAIAMIDEWSFPHPITLEGIQELPSRTYDEIRNTVAPFVSELIPDFGVNPDPKAITENSTE